MPSKGNCCTNFCAMWRYQKIVTQAEQYAFNKQKIEEWRLAMAEQAREDRRNMERDVAQSEHKEVNEDEELLQSTVWSPSSKQD